MIKVLVNGACGRMGREVVKSVLEDPELQLVAAVDLTGGVDAGTLVGFAPCGVRVLTDIEQAIKTGNPDVMVDFTQPDVVFRNACVALKLAVSPVIGTTGLSDSIKVEIAKIATENRTPAFIAPNFAIGGVLMMLLAREAAKYFSEVEIIELHHDKKLDAPSGTAIQTAEMISEVRKAHKQGHLDEKEKLEGARGADKNGIRIHSVRLPGYVAHQEVIFGGIGQTLSIRHDSTDRESFMPGVLLACKKVRTLSPGLTIGLENIMR